MTKTNTLRRVRVLPVGGAKACTNDNTGGPDFELNQKRYKAG